MPRRKQKLPCKTDESVSTCKRRRTSSQVINGPDVPWSKEERERLIQGLHDDNCQFNWRALKKCVGTRDVKQVKKYFEQLKEEQKSSAGLDNNLGTRNVSPIQAWIDLLEKLKNSCSSGAKDVVGTVIPQVMRIAAIEPREDQGDTGPVPDYHKIYTCLCNLLKGQPLPPLLPFDADVLVTLLEGVEKKLLSCDVSEQTRFMRQSFKHYSNALVEKQVQNLAASLGSPSHTSCHPTIEGEHGSTCSQSQTQESGRKIMDSPPSYTNFSTDKNNASVLTQAEDRATEDVAEPDLSHKNATNANLNEERAKNAPAVINVKSKTSDVNERVLRPRKNKSQDCPETEGNQLASLNPLNIPVELLNFYSKCHDTNSRLYFV